MSGTGGDIVITVSGDTNPLTDAVTRAERVLGRLNTATEQSDRKFRALAGTTTEIQSRIDGLVGVTDKLAKSAKDTARSFAEFDEAKSRVDRLRASFDPLFAASKRYEAAMEDLDAAQARGVITQREYADLAQRSAKAYLGAANDVSGSSSRLASQVQNASYQVGDFFVQIASGTDGVRALSQQLPQLLGGFGLWGAVAGAAVAAGGALVQMLGDTSSAGHSSQEAIGDLSGATNDLREALDTVRPDAVDAIIERYGILTEATRRQVQLLAEQAQMQAQLNATMVASSMSEDFGGFITTAVDDVRRLFETSNDGARSLLALMSDLEQARGLDAQIAAATELRDTILEVTGGTDRMTLAQFDYYKKVNASVDALLQAQSVAERIGQTDVSSGISAASARAQDLAANLQAALEKAQALGGYAPDMNRFATVSPFVDPTQNAPASSPRPQQAPHGTGGVDWGTAPEKKGGGAAKDPLVQKLESVRNALSSQAELELAAYAAQQKTLEEALEKRKLTQIEYNDLTEKAQQQHAEKMAQIDAYRYGDGLQKTGAFFGDMASAMASGNEKMQKIAQKFAAVEALINAWRAYNQTLADPSLPFFAKFAAAASVLASGLNAVQTIKGASGSSGSKGSSASSSAASMAATVSPTQIANYRITGDVIGRQTGEELVSSINAAIKDGYQINLEWA